MRTVPTVFLRSKLNADQLAEQAYAEYVLEDYKHAVGVLPDTPAHFYGCRLFVCSLHSVQSYISVWRCKRKCSDFQCNFTTTVC